jgi:hypothetical protein
MSRKQWVIDLVEKLVKDRPTAELVVDRLTEEGVLVLGYGDKDVEQVVGKFQDTFGNTKTTQRDRFAAHRMVQKYGTQSVLGVIQMLADNNTEKYAPVVGSVSQLEDKWVNVLSFLRNIRDTDEIDV